MASANNDKGKEPLEVDHQDPKLKEGQMAGGSRAREPTFVGSINADVLFLIICGTNTTNPKPKLLPCGRGNSSGH
jgi:hypothetical protein